MEGLNAMLNHIYTEPILTLSRGLIRVKCDLPKSQGYCVDQVREKCVQVLYNLLLLRTVESAQTPGDPMNE